MVIGDPENRVLQSLADSEFINVFSMGGINVESLLKYDKLVLDLRNLRKLEHKMYFEGQGQVLYCRFWLNTKYY